MQLPKPVRQAKAPKRIKRNPANRGKKVPSRRKARKVTEKTCDKLWSQVVKESGRCLFAAGPAAALTAQITGKRHACKGYLQAMHGFSRIYRGTRWDLRNGFPGCAAVHYYYTLRPQEWDRFLRAWWGETLFDRLWAIRNAVAKPDHEKIAADLRQVLTEWRAA